MSRYVRLPPFAHILAITTLNAAAVYAVRPMISYRALQLGAGPFEIGLIASSYAAFALFAAFLIGRWTDRFGPHRFLVVGAGLVGLSSLSASWIGSVLGLGVANALIGLGQIMNLVAMQTVVANQAVRRERDERFGYYTMAASGGQLIGPAAAGFLAGYASADAAGANLNLTPVFVFAAVLAGISVAFSAALRGTYMAPASRRSEAPANHLSAAWSVLRRPSIPQAMLSSLSVVLSTDLLVAYLPAYGEANALPVELIGFLLALRAGGSMVSRLLMGRLIRWMGRGPVLAGSLLLAGLGFGALPLLPHPVVLVILMLLLGLGLGLGQPMSIAWIANRVPRDQRGTALGVRLTGSRLGQLVLPSVMGTIAGAAGLAAMFWTLAAILGSVAGMVWQTEFEDPVDDAAEPP